uniref:Basic 7S globulin 2 n=1 Tax=Aegilops tauschii TaxID=37682 RepID=N1QUW7_AEGTA
MAQLLPLLVLAVSLAWPASCKPLPVLVPVTKDPATLLYTIPFHYGADLVVDTAGPLVWSTCQRGHLPAEFPCNSPTCRLANAFHAPSCRARGCGRDTRKDRTCTAYPYNPVTGACAAGDLVHTRFVANTTDGIHPVSQVSVRALAACAPSRLLKSLPRGASGVAGLAGSGLALPAQAFARALKAQGAQGGPVARPVMPVPPFELCYDTQSLANTRIGYLVPGVTLTLGGGTNWTMNGLSSMVDLRPGTACLAFARMEGVKAGDRSAPAVLVGGFQMENTVLEFDVAKKRLGFVRLPFFTQCGHFNFTKTGY